MSYATQSSKVLSASDRELNERIQPTAVTIVGMWRVPPSDYLSAEVATASVAMATLRQIRYIVFLEPHVEPLP
jgi:hypothetical protein